MRRRLFGLDVDGTLARSDSSIADPVVAEVRRLAEQGHEVVIATGRSVRHTLPILERLGITPEWVVCANGAIVLRRDGSSVSGYRHEFVETFNPRDVLTTISSHLLTARYAVEDEGGALWYTEPFTDEGFGFEGHQVPFEELMDRQVTRIVVISPDHDLEEFLEIVQTMGLSQVSYSVGWTAWLDIAPDGVDKSTGLEKVRERVGVPLADVVVVGDGRNDIGMFRWARRSGVAVAMGQAPEDVAEAAGRSIGTVQEDGLAAFLAEF